MTDYPEPTEADIRAFTKAADTLARLGKKGLYLYLASDELNLMAGPSHDDNEVERQHAVRASVHIPKSGGGDW